MILTDTHTHLYLEQFDKDRHEVVKRAIQDGVRYMLLPNINSQTIQPMMELCRDFPFNIFPMTGLHPTDVKGNFREELDLVHSELEKGGFFAIGETGIDLYWDKTFLKEQQFALREQVQMAKDLQLPIVLHVRDSFDEVFEIIGEMADENLTGVFHCFTGTLKQAETIMGWDFKMGIGGVLTYKNSGLNKVMKEIPMEYLMLETDSPFLAPMPFRGKRNESSFVKYVAAKLADVKNISVEEVAEITTRNAVELFRFPSS